LATQHGVATHCAAQRLVHRAVSEELICRGAVELRAVDELLAQIRVGAEVKKAQCGQ
jgi:hypothetical protein